MDNTQKRPPDQLNFDNQIRGLFIEHCDDGRGLPDIVTRDIKVTENTPDHITLSIVAQADYPIEYTIHLSVKDLRALVSSARPKKAVDTVK